MNNYRFPKLLADAFHFEAYYPAVGLLWERRVNNLQNIIKNILRVQSTPKHKCVKVSGNGKKRYPHHKKTYRYDRIIQHIRNRYHALEKIIMYWNITFSACNWKIPVQHNKKKGAKRWNSNLSKIF